MPVAKSSPGRLMAGGAERTEWLLRDGAAAERIIHNDDGDGIRDADPSTHRDARQVGEPLKTSEDAPARWGGRQGVRAVRDLCAAAITELAASALRLSRGDPALATHTVWGEGELLTRSPCARSLSPSAR